MNATVKPLIADAALDLLWRKARSFNDFTPEPVTDAQLRALYELAKWGPTTANSQPQRVVFVRSAEAKEKLKPALSGANQKKVMGAPVVAILAYDMRFYEHLPRLFHNPQARSWYETTPEAIRTTALRNSTLQGAYFMIAARALGLDCGPMSGFDQAKVDEEFFAAGKPCFGCEQEFFPEGHVKANFLCNLGYGEPGALQPRLPRLPFNEACSLL